MSGKCTDCPHFVIRQMPIKHFDSGMAMCKKYDLACDWVSKQQLNRLRCIEEDNHEDHD